MKAKSSKTKPYIGQRVTWPRRGEGEPVRGTILAPMVRLGFSGSPRIAVQWDDKPCVSYHWPPDWEVEFGPLSLLDALAEQGRPNQCT